MAYNNVGLSQALWTANGLNQLSLNRMFVQSGLPYRVSALAPDGLPKIKGAFTYSAPEAKGAVVGPILSYDLSSLYPSVMIRYNICPTTLVGVFQEEEIEVYISSHNVIEISDDPLYKHAPSRTFAVFSKQEEKSGLLAALCSQGLAARE